MDIFGPSTPSQKGKAIGAAFDTVIALLSVGNADERQRERHRNTILDYVPEQWTEAAAVFAEQAEYEYQRKTAATEVATVGDATGEPG